MKFYNLLLSILVSISTYALEFVHYPEDIYLADVSQELIDQAQRSAQKMGFAGKYQFVSAKKAGIAINPANQFIASGINPTNALPIIIVNPEWFSQLPIDQQDAGSDAIFIKCIVGNTHPLVSYILLIYVAAYWLVFIAIFLFLKRFTIGRKRWVRFALTFCILLAFNMLFAARIQNSIATQLNNRHYITVYKKVLENGTNKNALIGYLVRYDALITEELEKGQLFWKPAQGLLAQYAEELQKN